MSAWLEFRAVARPTTDWSEVGAVLCLDPGETTGWSVWIDGLLEVAGEWDTYDPSVMAAQIDHIKEVYWQLRLLVYEEYRIRGNKAKQHVGSEVITIQHIGAIKVAADQLGIKLVKQSAGMAKGFATDAKLRRWGLWQTNHRHANDSIRHGVYWHLFGYRKEPAR